MEKIDDSASAIFLEITAEKIFARIIILKFDVIDEKHFNLLLRTLRVILF